MLVTVVSIGSASIFFDAFAALFETDNYNRGIF